MSYATIEDVSILTGEIYEGDQEDYLKRWLRTFDILIDDLIESYGKDPLTVSVDRKNLVATMMGQVAAENFQRDSSVVSESLTSGDTSESQSRIAGGSTFSRISRIEPIYLKLLGLKNVPIANLRTETRW